MTEILRNIIKVLTKATSLFRKQAKVFSERHYKVVIFIKFSIIYGIFFMSAWYKPFDPDFGWHLQAGNYIRENGIPSHDLFTYTASAFRWIDHEWLSDVFVSVLYQSGGYGLLAGFYALMWSSSLFISRAYKRLSILVIAALAMIPYAGVRATTWTVLCLSILLAIIRSKSTKIKYAIPVLMLFWANVHGGFSIGLAILGYQFIKEKKLVWLQILSLGFIATCVNPYGPRLYQEVIRTLFDNGVRWQIAEWFPASFLLYYMPFIYSLIWVVTWLITRKKKLRMSVFELSPLFFLASLSSNRHFPLFVVVSAGEIAGNLGQVISMLPKKLDLPRRIMLYSLPSLLILFTIWQLFSMTYNKIAYNNIRENAYPVNAVSYLSANPCPGNIFNNYNFGGYMIWKLPGVKLYIDGRLPHWRDDKNIRYFDRYHSVVTDNDATNSEDFATYNIQCVLWPNDTKMVPLVESVERAKWTKIEEASDVNYSLWIAPQIKVDKPLPKF